MQAPIERSCALHAPETHNARTLIVQRNAANPLSAQPQLP